MGVPPPSSSRRNVNVQFYPSFFPFGAPANATGKLTFTLTSGNQNVLSPLSPPPSYRARWAKQTRAFPFFPLPFLFVPQVDAEKMRSFFFLFLFSSPPSKERGFRPWKQVNEIGRSFLSSAAVPFPFFLSPSAGAIKAMSSLLLLLTEEIPLSL